MFLVFFFFFFGGGLGVYCCFSWFGGSERGCVVDQTWFDLDVCCKRKALGLKMIL